MEGNDKNVLDEHGQPIVRTPAVLQRMGIKTKAFALGVSAVLALIAGVIISLETIGSFVSEKISYIWGQEVPVVLIEPIEYFAVLRELNDPDPPVTRSQPKRIPGILIVDAVVSQLNQVYYVDLRLANQSDNPLLISSVGITVKEVRSYPTAMYLSKTVVSEVYDIDISNLLNPGDRLTQPLEQSISPKETDRFVLRISAPRAGLMIPDEKTRIAKQLSLKTRFVFDIEVTTSAGILLIKEQSAIFGGDRTIRLIASRYFKELDTLADRRSADRPSHKAIQTD